MKRQFFGRRSQAVLLAGALSIGLGIAGLAAAAHVGSANPPVVLKVANDGPSRTGFGPVVKKVLPAVVNIASTKVTNIPTGFDGGMPDDPHVPSILRELEPSVQPPREAPEQREQGLGSGVIMSSGWLHSHQQPCGGQRHRYPCLARR